MTYFFVVSFDFSFFYPLSNAFSNPNVGASIRSDKTVASKIDQNISAITTLIALYGYQYKSILAAKVPSIITMKWVR